jgi:hypothetical protein
MREEDKMLDVLVVLLTMLFFGGNIAFALACDRLMGGGRR